MLTESSLVERKKADKRRTEQGNPPPRTKKYYAVTKKKILTILAIAMILNHLKMDTDSKSRNSNMRQKDQKVGVLDSSIKTQSQESSGATNGDTLETPPKQTALKPPFRIVQCGQPRSGSTFQTHLLDAIISMKSPSSTHIIREFFGNESMALTRKLLDHESYIGKTHNCGGKESGRIITDAAKKGEVSVFKSIFSANSSSQINSFPYAVYTQESNNLLSCSLCEVDNYKNVFNLSDEEVQHVKDYMSKYEIIRRCCGMQMSKYEVKRLNGCNMQKYRQLPEYPNCEQHNKTDIELQYVNNPGGIENHIFYHKFVWSKLGDCQRFDEIIASGRGFNNRKFDGSQC